MSWKKTNLNNISKTTLSTKSYTKEEKYYAKKNLELLHSLVNEVHDSGNSWHQPSKRKYTSYTLSRPYEITLFSLEPFNVFNENNENNLDFFPNYSNDSFIEDNEFSWNDKRQYLYKICNNEVVDIANFYIKSVKLIRFINNTDDPQNFVGISIFCKNKLVYLEILKEKFSDLKIEISKKLPQCIVCEPKIFQKYAANKYNSSLSANIEFRYKRQGWYKEKNKLYYFNNSMKTVESLLSLKPDKNYSQQFLEHFMSLSDDIGKLSVILSYSLNTYLAAFYEEVNLESCKCVLYISAPTGTGKTTLVKILSKALLDKEGRDILRFEDTIASLEESLFQARDQLIIIDDFYAKGNKYDDQNFKKKASDITRIIGDSYIKGKMGADRKPLPDRKYRGGIIATGEYIDLNTYSSYLRCWILKLKANSIKFNEDLNILQNNPDIAKGFYSLWIKWLEDNQNTILNKIVSLQKESIFKLSRIASVKKHKRFLNNATCLFVGLQLFKDFIKHYNLYCDADKIMNTFEEEIHIELRLLEEVSPESIVINALKIAIEENSLTLAINKSIFPQGKYDGYYDNEFVFISTSKLDNVVKDYADKQNYGIKFDSNVKEQLLRTGCLEKFGNNYFTRYSKNIPGSSRPRLYKINRKVADL